MEPAHHGADRHVHDLGDLLVGETLDVGEQHGHPELLGQGLEGGLHHLVGDVRAPRSVSEDGKARAPEPPEQEEVLVSSRSTSGRRCLAR
jgi:hypothetical protein